MILDRKLKINWAKVRRKQRLEYYKDLLRSIFKKDSKMNLPPEIEKLKDKLCEEQMETTSTGKTLAGVYFMKGFDAGYQARQAEVDGYRAILEHDEAVR